MGLSGGEIFHEMMLRQGVKHVCMYLQNAWKRSIHLNAEQSATPVVPFYPYSTPSITPNTSNSFFRDMSKAQATWQRDMRERQACQELFS